MKSAILIRSGSFRTPSRLRIGSDNSGSGTFSLRRTRSISMSPRSPLPVDVKMVKQSRTIRRARSDTDLIVSDRPSRIWSPSARVLEEDDEKEGAGDHKMFRGSSTVVMAPEEEVEFSGGGRGRGIKIGGGGGDSEGGDQNEKKRIENYYQEMLRWDPSNPLLLRNYGRFLHEVEGDVKGAEECYNRAILASPKDGDMLSLYGKLVWETHRDGERASGYFERAVEAAPEDCYVLGSYASFLWEAEEDGEEEAAMVSSAPLVQATGIFSCKANFS